MKEIKILIQNLRNFPSHFFVIAKPGNLEVVDKDGDLMGEIKTGDNSSEVVKE